MTAIESRIPLSRRSSSGCKASGSSLHSASLANTIQHHAKRFGINVEKVSLDFAAAIKHSRQVSDQNAKGVGFLMKKHKVTVIEGERVLALLERYRSTQCVEAGHPLGVRFDGGLEPSQVDKSSHAGSGPGHLHLGQIAGRRKLGCESSWKENDQEQNQGSDAGSQFKIRLRTLTGLPVLQWPGDGGPSTIHLR